MITSNLMENICKFGTYYNPAWKHYGVMTNVVCDRCHKDNLNSCIGWQTFDLCLGCVQEVTNTVNKSHHIAARERAYGDMLGVTQVMTTNMMQNQFRK